MAVVRPAESLLEQVSENALDDDYYVVRAGESYGEGSASTPAVGFVVAVLAAMLTITAVQTQAERPGSELARQTLAADVADRREVLGARQAAVEALRAEVQALRGDRVDLSTDVARDAVAAGARRLRGSGLVVTLADGPDPVRDGAVTADDVTTIVNGLWYAGAEAVAVGGRRLASTSSIGSRDGRLIVDSRPVDTPLRLVAIGDSAALRSRLQSNPTGRYLRERADEAGISVGMAPSDDVSVPSAPTRLTELRRAEPLPVEPAGRREEGSG